MVKVVKRNAGQGEFESESFGNYASEYSIEEMLQEGGLVKVTAWVRSDMGFATNDVRVHAAITASLWCTIVSVPASCRLWQTIRGRGNQVMWMAAWALRLARERGDDSARFQSFLPTSDDDDNPGKALRTVTHRQAGRNWIVIEHCEERTFIL